VSDVDRESWLTYAEVGKLLGITSAAARMLAKRRGWARRTPNAYGDRARVLVPADAAVASRSRSALNGELHGEQRAPSASIDMLNMIREMIGEIVTPLTTQLDHERRRTDEAIRQANEATAAERIGPTPGPGTAESAADPLAVIGIQTLSQAVEFLHEDLASERERVEQAERRADELLALFAEGQRQIGDLYGALADARTAAMISSNEASALRATLDELRARPWWKRWFR
jgi:hypothetical protein